MTRALRRGNFPPSISLRRTIASLRDPKSPGPWYSMSDQADVVERTPIRLSPDEVLFFNRQLASMARLNVPIAKGLRLLAREQPEDSNFRKLIEAVQADLEQGVSLRDALAKFPESFNSMHLEIIKAGESTGNLSVILEELNSHTEAMQRVKNRIVEAILYPAVISVVIFLFVLFFLMFVAPQFEEMLVKRQAISAAATADVSERQAEDAAFKALPPITQVLFTASGALRNPVILLAFVGGAVIFAVLGLRKLSRMGEEYDDFLFRMPLFARLFESAALMKITRTMRDLLNNGVSMVETLRLVSGTVGKNRIQRKLEELRGAVEEGGSFSRNLAGGQVFPETMVWKLQMAEEKGIIEDALAELARDYELRVDAQTTLLSKLLAPILLVGMGGIVFLMFLACFIPLTTIYSS